METATRATHRLCTVHERIATAATQALPRALGGIRRRHCRLRARLLVGAGARARRHHIRAGETEALGGGELCTFQS